MSDFIVGLTGGVASGKSEVTRRFEALGVHVADADVIARAVVEPGQPALAEVRKAFGADIVGPDGRLRRDALAQRVFADAADRARLESLLHPPMRALWHARMETWRAAGHPLAVVVIPLLFETRAEPELDATLCVACTAATQHARLRARGWSPEQIAQRVRAQWPIEQKISRADYLVWTEAGLEVLAAQLERILQGLN